MIPWFILNERVDNKYQIYNSKFGIYCHLINSKFTITYFPKVSSIPENVIKLLLIHIKRTRVEEYTPVYLDKYFLLYLNPKSVESMTTVFTPPPPK